MIKKKKHKKTLFTNHEVLFNYAGFSRLPPKTKDLDPGYRIRHVTEQELMEASGILRSSKVAGKSPIKMEVESWEIHEKIRKWWAIPETWRFRGKIIEKKMGPYRVYHRCYDVVNNVTIPTEMEIQLAMPTMIQCVFLRTENPRIHL